MFYAKAIVSIIISILLISCAVDDGVHTSCDDIDFNSLTSTIIDIDGSYSSREYSIETIDSEMKLKYGEIESEILYSKYAILVDMNKIQYVKAKNIIDPSWLNYFIKSAFSCSIAPHYVTEVPMVSINISSNQDYDSTHLSGASLNEYFRIYYRPERNIYKNSTISELNSIDENAPAAFTLYLDNPPAIDGFYSFVASFVLENGLEYKVEFSHNLVVGG